MPSGAGSLPSRGAVSALCLMRSGQRSHRRHASRCNRPVAAAPAAACVVTAMVQRPCAELRGAGVSVANGVEVLNTYRPPASRVVAEILGPSLPGRRQPCAGAERADALPAVRGEYLPPARTRVVIVTRAGSQRASTPVAAEELPPPWCLFGQQGRAATAYSASRSSSVMMAILPGPPLVELLASGRWGAAADGWLMTNPPRPGFDQHVAAGCGNREFRVAAGACRRPGIGCAGRHLGWFRRTW